ncbi:GNAT family N-acetyltransferase [Streptomyces griseoaurantiacus]|uniref:GNAT family N-acetyltransferase n=1 Tax=Streptomyces griseoaurantiacus TaxID=68213 RepID=UPI00367ACF02
MTDISATAFFRQAGEGPLGGIDFEHEEIDTGGSKRPTKIHLHAVDPDSGDRMGTLTYHVPRRKADKILVEHLGTEEDHRGKGVASALMDEMQTRHPGTPIDHGDRTDAGKGWWEKYTDGKTVRRGRTMASLTDAFRATASHPRAEVPPEQAEALEHPSLSEYRRRSLELAKNPTPGTVVWRGETRSGEPHDALRESGVGMHWTVNPDSVVVPRPHESERRVLWQGRIEDPSAQTIPRSHPSWGGRTGHSMDHEAEVRFQPGSKVHVEGAYVWHGQGDPQGHPVPRMPERTHPDWKWHPVGEHAEVRNLGHIDYGQHETPTSDAKMPTPWHGADPHTVLQQEHEAGNHHASHPGGTYDDIDWNASDEHVDGHSNAVMTDMALKDGYIKPHELSHEDASEWLRWHPDRAAIEQRHSGKTAALRRTAAVEDGDDIPSRLLNPHGHHIKAKVGNYRNVEMVPREEIARYASQETDPEHAKAVGHHLATTGEMEPLLLHYHPASGEAYLGEGNHRLRASGPLRMEHLPVRVQRNNYGLPGPGVKVPQDHPNLATGEHIPHDIKPSDIGLTTVDKPTMSEADKKTELAKYRLLHGSKTASADTPVPDNTKPYEHEHDWLPRDHFFAPGEKGLDPRLFDENERMHPEVRQHILGLLDSFWAPKYGDSWQSWARVYLAGSEASHWYGNNDLDVLIGINHEALNHHVDAFCGEPDKVVDDKLTDELRHGLNDDARMLPGPDGKETGPWESTFFVNPDSYDIRDIKPYAAYDITADEWAVKPVEVPNDFGPEKLPESTWDVFEAIQKLIKAIRELPEGVREREGSALYDYLHADRHSAFGPDGTGLYDPANSVWKALDKAPGKPLQQLIDWKHAHDGATANDQENAA